MVSFNKSSCLMQGPSLKSPLEFGRSQNGLYYLCSRCHTSNSAKALPQSLSTIASSSSKSCFLAFSSKCNLCNSPHYISTINYCNVTSTFLNNSNVLPSCVHTTNTSDFVISHGNCVDHLWHNSLGHALFVKMKGLSSIPIVFSPKQSFTCTICPMARQARLSFPTKSTISSTNLFDLLHMDL